ncbi:hypothetical protein D3C73_782980 [compost metagenome]
MANTIEQKTNTADLSIVINDTIELPIKLPGSQRIGLFKYKMLIGNQRKYTP